MLSRKKKKMLTLFSVGVLFHNRGCLFIIVGAFSIGGGGTLIGVQSCNIPN